MIARIRPSLFMHSRAQIAGMELANYGPKLFYLTCQIATGFVQPVCASGAARPLFPMNGAGICGSALMI